MSIAEMAERIQNLDADTPLKMVIVDQFIAEPDYEACTPIQNNVWRGDDPDRMPFIPNADDPTFDAIGHTSFYGSLSWQEDTYDPNRM